MALEVSPPPSRRLAESEEFVASPDNADSAGKTLSFRTAKPSIQQDFYAVFVNGAKTLYTDKAKLEKHLAECPDAEWQKFDNIKDALVSVRLTQVQSTDAKAWTGGGGAEAAGDNTTSGRVIETSAEKGLERASNDPSEGTEQAEIGEAEISDLGGRVSPGSSSSGSTADRLSPLSDDRPLSSGLSVDLDNEPVEEEIVKPAPAENQDEKAVESRVDQAAGSGSAKSAVQPPSELASAEDIEEPEPSSPLLSTLQHEIEWCRSYPATNSNWVPVRFSFDGRIVSPR
ncbi:hypothetical protein A1Q1_01798 [Trichosporon asahii var. asahii CBS 2479]|uniref:Uncharacterized protein n=1 Tax=Trichosporon asahii var. asahii (strain ATCC 90039 / CBS 2479 / JCM 2466 / KCTC 7840 / NBRC 103889/ NCYC 2677 / UAMH 7654) TaxID=1186058 RepID=J6EWZ8_TRIAS|nr:hypothetical protein A1Q1_01798 [Trichosporon asahii var. asahii CBS 2479]EJT49149.1 hypothetical protein A1Q1_01798 [Trichosporon asahii var. asahii CBS 2479]